MLLNKNSKLLIRDIIKSIKITSRDYSLTEIGDIIFSIPRIEELLAISTDELSERELINQFLRDRWSRVANTNLCYTRNTEHSVNWICHILAECCSGSENILSTLMPTVQVEDVYANNLDSLHIGTFIISDDRSTFINLEGLVNLAYYRIINSDDHIYATTDANGHERDLTANELRRLGFIYTDLEEMHNLTVNRSLLNCFFYSTPIIYDALVALRNGLLLGDVNHEGREMNAGSPANIAIANFYDIYSKLSARRRSEIRNIRHNNHSLGGLFDLIFRDNNSGYTSVRYCIQLIGQQLDEIIRNNRASLQSFQMQAIDRIESIKTRLLRDIAQNRFITSAANTPLQDSNNEPNDNAIMDIIKGNLRRYTPHQNHFERNLLLNSARFTITESRRARGALGNAIRRLLIAIGLEAYSFNQRPKTDNRLVLEEVFRRITMLSGLESGLWATSRRNWINFLNHMATDEVEGIDNEVNFSLSEGERILASNLRRDMKQLINRRTTLEIYNTIYLPADQCQILSSEIISCRSTLEELRRNEVQVREEEKAKGEKKNKEEKEAKALEEFLDQFDYNFHISSNPSAIFTDNRKQRTAPKDLNEEKQDNLSNPNYWYTDQNILQLLHLRLRNQLFDIDLLAATPIENDDLLRASLAAGIQKVMGNHVAAVSIPININQNHWVGLVMKRKGNGRLQAIFTDPKGLAIPQDASDKFSQEAEENRGSCAAKLLAFINQINNESVEFIDLQYKQQHNDNDCGVFIVENLYTILTADTNNLNAQAIAILLPKADDNGRADYIRSRHDDLLAQQATPHRTSFGL